MEFKKLRRVKDHVDIILPEDHNDHVDNWYAQLEFDEEMAKLVRDPTLDELISKLKDIISKMRRVKSGDYVEARDHNLFVDAWEVQLEINKLLAKLVLPPITLEELLVLSAELSWETPVKEKKTRLLKLTEEELLVLSAELSWEPPVKEKKTKLLKLKEDELLVLYSDAI